MPNVPPLRFPEFTGEWDKKQLQEECNFFSGGTPSSSNKEYYEGDIPFIRSGEIDAQYTELFLTQKGYNSSSAKMVDIGDILLALYGATSGEIAISKMHGAINQAILCIRSPYNNVFVKSVWEKHVQHILQTYLQGGQGNLSADIVKKLSFYFPSIREQNKISKLIASIDKRISTQIRVIDKLESLIKGIYNSILWREYKQVSLSDIFIERNERTTSNNQYEVLSSTAKGLFRQADYFDKEVASANNVGYKVLRLGDVVLSPQNLWLGNINYNDIFEIGIVSPSYKVFSIRKQFNPYYVSCFLKTHRALYEYANASEQGASVVRRNLNLDAFMAITFLMPDKDIQDSVSKKLQAINKKLSVEKQIHDKLKEQKNYLLSQMFI